MSAVLVLLGAGWMATQGDFLHQPAVIRQFWLGAAVMGLGYGLSGALKTVSPGWFWGVTLISRLMLLAMAVNSDLWRYLWEGYIQTQGFSPYDFAPNAPELAHLRPEWWSQINHQDVSAIYPPITQWGFRALAALTPAAWLFKLAFAAADLSICALLSRSIGRRAALVYAWNPLVIYSFSGSGHYDSWFLLPLVGAGIVLGTPDRWRPERSESAPRADLSDSSGAIAPWRWLCSAALIGVSIAVKWISLPVLAFLCWRSLRSGVRLMVAVLLTGLMPIAISALPFCSAAACPLIPTDSGFVVYGRSAELIPFLVGHVWPASRWENWLYGFPLVLVVGWLLLRAKSFWAFTEWYLMGLLVLSPIVHAWYFTWLVPFAAVSRNGGTRLVSLSAFIYFALTYRSATGDGSWLLTLPERAALWMPFIVGVLFWLLRHDRPNSLNSARSLNIRRSHNWLARALSPDPKSAKAKSAK
ncbi:MAG: hypothetical protein AAGF66_08385 [Cyanobacteria bacterium P01_H01_bin.119]